jgi:predicted dehydrogenase
MNEIRIGLIGCGNIGRMHLRYFPQVPRLKLAAVADCDPKALEAAVQEQKVPGFATGEALIDSGLVDAVLIGTPHYFHPPLAIAAFKRGLHVLTEKPISVTAKAGAEAIAAHKKHPKLVFGAMFQLRLQPIYQKVKQILGGGQLGAMQRVTWIITTQCRTQAYYDSGTWRATWGGEGGGCLINQMPHHLDLFCQLFGTPVKVHAFIGIGKYHRIEVEDEVNAFVEYASGATGAFITNTAEQPGTDRLEVACDRGRLVTDGRSRIELFCTDVSVAEFNRTTKESFPHLPITKHTIEIDSTTSPGHKGITTNFIDAILDGKPLIAPAEEGLASIELANAMIMSGLTGKTVPIPTDREAYDRLIRKLAKTSKFQKGKAVQAKADMEASYPGR